MSIRRLKPGFLSANVAKRLRMTNRLFDLFNDRKRRLGDSCAEDSVGGT